MLSPATIVVFAACCLAQADGQRPGRPNPAIDSSPDDHVNAPIGAYDEPAEESPSAGSEAVDSSAARSAPERLPGEAKPADADNTALPAHSADRQIDKSAESHSAEHDEELLSHLDEAADQRAQQHLPAEGEPDARIETGRDALGEGWVGGYPWYDESADALKPVRVRAQRQGWNWNLPNFSLPGWIDWVAWAAVACVLLLVAWLLLRAWRKQPVLPVFARAKVSEEDKARLAAQLEALPLPLRAGATNLLAEAARLYQQGNYREAIIYLYSYQLTELDKHHVLQLAKGKTNRQYVREVDRSRVPPHHSLRGLLEQTMVAFEDVFFGDYDLDRRRFEACWSRVEEFRSLLEMGATL